MAFIPITEQLSPAILAGFVLLAVWELCWKGIALWKAAQKKRLYWFIALLVINTAGILPIIYIYLFDEKK